MKEKRKNPQGCFIIQFDLNPCFSFRNLLDSPHELNPEVVFFPSELKVCGNNRYIPVSSACKTMATQSKRDQQPIKPKPPGLCANSDVSRVEELVEAACSGFLPQELSASSCSFGQKGNIESQTWNLMGKHRDDLQYCRIIVSSLTVFVLLLLWSEWNKERGSRLACLLVLAIVLRLYP